METDADVAEQTPSFVLDPGALTPGVVPSARDTFDWAELLAQAGGMSMSYNTLTVFTVSDEDPAADLILETIDLVVQVNPGSEIIIYEGYGGSHDHVWYTDLLAELTAARPDIDISLLSIGPVLESVLRDPMFVDLPDATTDEGLALLAGMATYTLIFQAEVPVEFVAPENLSPELAAAYPKIGALVAEVVLGPVEDPTLLKGTNTNDTFDFDAEITAIDGGDGRDTLVLTQSADDVLITENDDGTITVSVSDAQDLRLTSVERLAFAESQLAFDTEGNAGQAYRLYQAVFDRVPDKEGLGFWIGQLDAENVTLEEAAAFFIASEEFAATYGTPDTVSDEDYLTLLYANVLDRKPDEAGFDFWSAQQEKGITRSDMLVHFSESVENVALVAPAIDDGIWYI